MVEQNSNGQLEKRQLIIIVTDGEESVRSGKSNEFLKIVKSVIKNNPKIAISIVLMTSNEEIINNYNIFDNACIDGVDVNSCYYLESKECQKYGNDLTYGKYLAKLILGPLYPEIGHIDSKKESNLSFCSVMYKLFFFLLFTWILLWTFCSQSNYRQVENIIITLYNTIITVTEKLIKLPAVLNGNDPYAILDYIVGSFIFFKLFIGMYAFYKLFFLWPIIILGIILGIILTFVPGIMSNIMSSIMSGIVSVIKL